VIEIKNWGLVRIDDRLIHGQVIAVWVKHKRFTRIQIVDDVVAADAFMVDVLRLAAPAGLDVIAETLENSVKSLNENQSPEATMILMKSPMTAKRLYEAGITFNALNIGGMGMGPGRKNVFKNTAISKEEYQVLKSLEDEGVKVTFLSVPGEKSKDFADLPAM
jgi:mannose/fructose/N-acetylgalactosamine-specific phosphotransferase system component IIB